jgi:cobalt-zinc-cadmium efflux system outer membrane protein
MIRASGLMLVLFVSAYAQSSDRQRPGEPLTLDRALQLADRSNPQLKAAQAGVEGAAAGIITARQRPNPEIVTSFGRQRLTQDSSVAGQLGGFSFAQPVEWGGVRRARIGVATLARESTEYTLSEARLGLRSAVKQAFFEALRREGEIDLAADNLRNIEELRRRIEVQVKVGEAARLELVRADAEVATAKVQLRSAELRRATALAGLRAAIGAPLSNNIVPEGALEPKSILPPLSELRDAVVSRHPTVLQAEAEIRRAEAQLGLEREMRKPTPTLRTDFDRQPDSQGFRFGVSVPVPAWNRRQGEIAEAAAGLRQASATAELRKLEITASLERAYGVYEVAEQQLAALEAGALRQAEAALEASEAAFKFGERGIIEVLDAQRVLRGVRSDYLNAQYDRQSALIELERLQAIELGSRRP